MNEREKIYQDVAGLHMAKFVRNQNYPSAWHDGVDAALAVVREGREELEGTPSELTHLRAHLKSLQDFADLWYFVMDEAPLEFAKIVCEWSSKYWLQEAAKLRAAKRNR